MAPPLSPRTGCGREWSVRQHRPFILRSKLEGSIHRVVQIGRRGVHRHRALPKSYSKNAFVGSLRNIEPQNTSFPVV